MGRHSKQKACFACVDAKRRCNNGLPSCSRCIEKDIDCMYALVRPRRRRFFPGRLSTPTTHQLRLEDAWICSERDAVSQVAVEPQDGSLVDASFTTDMVYTAFDTPVRQPVPPLVAASQVSIFSGDPSWFLHPSAWTVAYHYQPPACMPSGPVFSNFIRGLQTWLSRFLQTGSNPFIHCRLYPKSSMPRCMQDAFAAISLSQHAQTGNELIVDDVSSSYLFNLLACEPTDESMATSLLSTREHLARTQALLIHLLLALFSPSIPRRAQAEGFIETLLRWTNQLWESASQDAAAALLFPGAAPFANSESDCLLDSASDLYHKFVLSESIRRTWILSNIATGVYYSHKGDWSAACVGDIHITTRAEVWEATSPARWEAVVRNQDPLFLYSLNGQSLVARGVKASQVDEFARHIFTVMWGLGKVEDWVVRTGDAVSIMY